MFLAKLIYSWLVQEGNQGIAEAISPKPPN